MDMHAFRASLPLLAPRKEEGEEEEEEEEGEAE